MSRFFARLAFSLLAVLPLTLPVLAQETPEVTDTLLTEFERLIESEREYYRVPGMAVAVIAGDEVVFSQGLGVRDQENNAPFTPQTRFLIGSTTKSMTSLLVAQLVDAGLIAWDTPVADIIPGFRTADPERTAQITIRDLMSMGTGLTSSTADGFYWGDWTFNDLVAAIGEQAVAGEYRQYYAYNNEVYALAGYAAALASGGATTRQSYAELLQERVFEPIGMPSAVITDDPRDLGDNFALPYEIPLIGDIDTPAQMSIPPLGIVAPSGGVWTTLEDMARYLMTQMNGGVTPEGERIVSEAALAETWAAGVPMGEVDQALEDAHYGMGWVSLRYQGVPIRYHDGSWSGYATQMVVFPDADVGLIIFSNSSTGALINYALTFAFAEMLYDLEPEASSTLREQFDTFIGQLEAGRASLPAVAIDRATVAPLLGEYEDGWQTELREDNTFWLSRGGWEFQLIPITESMYLIINNGAMGVPLSFDRQDDGVTLTIQIPSGELRIDKQR